MFNRITRFFRSVLRFHFVAELSEIAPLLVRLTTEAAEEEGAFQVPKEVEIEVNIAKEQVMS